jgi:molybdate/tungstate transport system permease protein
MPIRFPIRCYAQHQAYPFEFPGRHPDFWACCHSAGLRSCPKGFFHERPGQWLGRPSGGHPHSAAGIAILGIVSRGTWLGKAGEAAGITFVGGVAGIVLAMAFVSIPFLINAARDGFAAVPEKLEKAALNLGASPWRVFFTISLPLAKRSIYSGLIMMWARGLSEFGAVIIIAYHPMITPVLIWERFTSFGLSYARPVAAVFVLVCLAVFVLMRLLSKNHVHVRN